MKIQGLIAATFAAYHADGSVNLQAIPPLVEKLVLDGVRGVFVNGTNGEGLSLTSDERMAITEAYVRAAKERLLVLVHVGHASIAEARRLAQHAEEIRADAIAAVAAFYFKPATIDVLVESMAEIAAAAPGLPFYYYHIPSMTGVALDMVDFLGQAGGRIPTLTGIKFAAPHIPEFQACLNFGGGPFDILYASDEMLLSALVVGAQGAVGSTYTFAAPLYQRIMRHFQAGEIPEAAAAQMQSVELVRRFLKYASIPAQRAIMAHLGHDLGPCRLPLKALSPTESMALIQSLDEMEFSELIQK